MSLSTVKTLKVNKWKSNKNIHKLLMQIIDFINISHIFLPSIQSIPVYKDVYQFIYFLSVIYVCLAILMWGVLRLIICIWYLILPRIDFMYLLHFSYVVCTSLSHPSHTMLYYIGFFLLLKNKNFPTSLFKTIVQLCKLFLFPLHVLLGITEWNRVLSGLL